MHLRSRGLKPEFAEEVAPGFIEIVHDKKGGQKNKPDGDNEKNFDRLTHVSRYFIGKYFFLQIGIF